MIKFKDIKDPQDLDDLIKQIIEEDDKLPYNYKAGKDSILEGALIMYKYTTNVFGGAEHDIIYGPDMDDLIKGGLTDDDFKMILSFNWRYDSDLDCLTHFA